MENHRADFKRCDDGLAVSFGTLLWMVHLIKSVVLFIAHVEGLQICNLTVVV